MDVWWFTPHFSMVLKVCCLGFKVRFINVTLQLLRVGPFVENLPVAGLNEEDLLEAVRERLREDYADVFGDRDRDQKRRRPRRTTAMAAVFQVLVFNIIGNNQGWPKRWFTVGISIYIYTYIIHYYTWYINLFIFYEGSPLDLCCSLFCSVLARPKPSQILYRR